MSETIELRPARAEDARTIRRMIRAEDLDPTSMKWEHFIVAEDRGQIVAIGQVKEYRGCREVGSLVTLPRYRGRGLAARIVAALEARSSYPLYLLCIEQMAAYYGKLGYARISFWEAPLVLKLKLKLMAVLWYRLQGYRFLAMRKDGAGG